MHLDELGEWKVKAEFIDIRWAICGRSEKVVKTKYYPFFVVPEVPVMGTVGASISMLLAVFAYRIKRQRIK